LHSAVGVPHRLDELQEREGEREREREREEGEKGIVAKMPLFG
jgi:hypothetical protein